MGIWSYSEKKRKNKKNFFNKFQKKHLTQNIFWVNFYFFEQKVYSILFEAHGEISAALYLAQIKLKLFYFLKSRIFLWKLTVFGLNFREIPCFLPWII